MASLVTTITETLRYRGKIGQWSWVFHRLSGVGIVLFLVLHVIDTSWAAFYPDQYAQAIREYQSPLFTIGEFALVAAVVYHAFNGLRIVYFDYNPQLWHLQQRAATIVFALTAIVLIPVFILMFGHVNDFYADADDVAGLDELIGTQSQFLLGFIVIIVAALLLSFLYALITGEDPDEEPVKRASAIDSWFWSYMRISGILIVPLVFGHLAMMHVIQGVFDITAADHAIVGTDLVNQTGSAVEFVGDRWDYLIAGVAIWRVYDGLLLALVVLHGFNGLRYIVNDYAHNKIVNRALNWAIIYGGAALIILGMAALLAGVEETAAGIVEESATVVENPTFWLGG
jgi:succinate dehydrogenase cytochrome b556 subunit